MFDRSPAGYRLLRLTSKFYLGRRFGSLLALCLAASILLMPLGIAVSAGTYSQGKQPESRAINSSLPIVDKNQEGGAGSKPKATHTRGYIIEMIDGKSVCREARAEELPFVSAPTGATRERVGAAAAQGYSTKAVGDAAAVGLTINLNALSQLRNDPNRSQVIAAFQQAAQFWTSRIKSPVTIDIDIDYGVNQPGGAPFRSDVLGSTGSASLLIDYRGFLRNLIASASSPAEATLYNSLPASVVPTDTGNGGVIDINASVAKAVGVPVANGSIATIAFNKNFDFDFDPSNGISFDKVDFIAVATHEIGHALGFSSDAGEGSTATPTPWDLFRFRPGTTSATFSTAQRIMSIGGRQVFYTGQTYSVEGASRTELGLSTGGPSGMGGDGWQSSHWKAEDITGEYIGIMDPVIASGVHRVTTENDYAALEAIGWDLTGNAIIPSPPPAPPPPSNDNFANALPIGACSGQITGLNIGATPEVAEPSNPDSPTSTKSVWYQWQSPATSSVRIDTRGSNFDTVLAVYTGSSLNTLSLIANNDDTDDPNTSEREISSVVTFNATQGTVYRIAVNGFDNIGPGGDMGNIKLNWSESNCGTGAPTVGLTASSYTVNENEPTGVATITFNRDGDATAAVSVDYSTSDSSGLTPCETSGSGKASERCDYGTTVGTLRFAAGESFKSISVPIINDSLVDPSESFNITLRNPQGATLSRTTATVNIIDDDVAQPASNPVDDVRFFITEQYIDFLGRLPDAGGFQNWKTTLGNCPNGGFGENDNPSCDRIHVAAGFFQSDEFLNRGYFAFRFYMVAFNQRPTYAQFVPDMAQVGGPKSPAEEEASKVAFSESFVQRPEFIQRYGTLSGQALAAALLQTAGLPNLSINTIGKTNGQILRAIVETSEVFNKFLTDGTVAIQYFAFLRRDPDATGYQNNINTLRADPNNLRHMIFIFIYSSEYRGRFGKP